MRPAQAGRLAIVVLAAATLAGSASGKTTPSTTYVVKSSGYSVTIPTAWKLVPRTQAQIKLLIADLKKKKQTALASTYSSIISSAAGRSGLTAYQFQAFAWPLATGTPILTQVSVGVVKTTKIYGASDLKAIGAEYANELARNKGAKITIPKRITLPTGPAEFIEGTIPAGGGISNGLALYLIPHGKRVYELAFQIDGRLLSQATLFASIAQNFKFV